VKLGPGTWHKQFLRLTGHCAVNIAIA